MVELNNTLTEDQRFDIARNRAEAKRRPVEAKLKIKVDFTPESGITELEGTNVLSLWRYDENSDTIQIFQDGTKSYRDPFIWVPREAIQHSLVMDRTVTKNEKSFSFAIIGGLEPENHGHQLLIQTESDLPPDEIKDMLDGPVAKINSVTSMLDNSPYQILLPNLKVYQIGFRSPESSGYFDRATKTLNSSV